MADNTISPVVPNVSGGRNVSTGQKAVTQTAAQSGIDFKSYLGGRTAVQDNSTTFLKRRNSYTLNKNNTKEISIKTASKNSPTESEVKKITDDISSQIVEKVTDDLDISEDELNNAMQLLGLTAMAMNPGYVEEEITGIPTFEPSFHLPAIWITESQRERAESLGYTVVDPPSIIATHLTEVIRSHIAELLTRQDVQNLVNNLKESNPVIVDELIPKLLGLGEIQKVLQNLLSEGISIRDLLTIFETLADHAQTTRDTDVLTEYVRQGLKRAISSKYFPANETTSVITLDPAVEQEIMSSVKQTEQGSYLSLDPDRIKAIIKSVETEIGKLESLGKSAIIITSPIVRMYFKKMTEDYFKDLIVLSYNEVESNVELQSVGMVTA